MFTMKHVFSGTLPAAAFWVLSASPFPLCAQQYSEQDIANRHTVAYPLQRLQRDWLYQDLGSLDVKNVFVSKASNTVEKS